MTKSSRTGSSTPTYSCALDQPSTRDPGLHLYQRITGLVRTQGPKGRRSGSVTLSPP